MPDLKDEKTIAANDYNTEVLRGLGITREISQAEYQQLVDILASDDSAEDKKNALLNVDIINNEGIHPDAGWITTIGSMLKSAIG